MINGKKILALIPARKGSKGVPGKNIRLLGENPLISYIIQTAKQSRYIDTLIVSTDDDKAISISSSLGIEVPFKRPEELASDGASLISVVNHANEYYAAKGIKFDAIMSLQPTCPFIEAKTIDSIIELWDKTGAESVTTIAQYQGGHPLIAKRFDEDTNAISDYCMTNKNKRGTRRQDREKAFYMTGGVYLRDKSLLDKCLLGNSQVGSHSLGDNSRAIVLNPFEAVDINEELDFAFAEFLIQKGMINSNENTTL